jgi:hypothetical protein
MLRILTSRINYDTVRSIITPLTLNNHSFAKASTSVTESLSNSNTYYICSSTADATYCTYYGSASQVFGMTSFTRWLKDILSE